MDELAELLELWPEWEVSPDGAIFTAPDGCNIERDGSCPHGHISPLLALGLI